MPQEDSLPAGTSRELFLAALPEPTAAAVAALSPGAVDDVLCEHLAQGRLVWPDVEVAPAAFLTHLAQRFDAAPDIDALRALRAADLYVTCGCASGDPLAIVAFERAYFGEVDVAAARMRAGITIADEVKQMLRRALFVAEPGRTPTIAGFAGRGDLRGWVRVSAVRAVQRLLKLGRREVEATDDALLSMLSPAEDPELGDLRSRYSAPFAAAFHDAVAATSAEHRSLLRYQFVDGFSIDQIGRLYGVHRATAARRLVAARAGIRERTRDALRTAVGVSTEELDSIIRLVHSHLDISVERMLR